jgi:bifunctional UDP-N-acetylglucosamine pyrophosphorylase/glucosamine-1-phosphate N-acetyltransferase
MKNFACVVLAAGKGKRMRSTLTKVLHPICGKPMLFYVLKLVEKLNVLKTIVVVGRQKERVVNQFKNWNVTFVDQDKQLGTADAVMRAEGALHDLDADVLILAGDTPLLDYTTIRRMLKLHAEEKSDITLLTTELENPTGYGRILRVNGTIEGIVEEKDATEKERRIKEVNAGVYLFRKEGLFDTLKKIRPDNIQGEYYLTDVVRIIQGEKGSIHSVKADDWREVTGINDRATLSFVAELIAERIKERMMKSGVSIISPKDTVIEYGVEVGKDTVLYPFVTLEGNTSIGEGCRIHSYCSIRDSMIGNDAIIGEHSIIQSSKIPDKKEIPPYSKVRDEK